MNSKRWQAWRTALPAVALLTFWLPLLGPHLQAGHMTCSHDGGLYLLRISQLDTLVRQGKLWPRWLPGMVFGYGYPLFNFYPALSLYPAVVLHGLGLSLLQAWNLTLAGSLLAAGLGMYLWARQVMSQAGAFVAAAAYMLAPYQLYDVYWRGNIAESLSLPLLPLVLWAALRIAQARRPVYVSAGALLYAALLLTHAPAGLMLTALLLTYGLALAWGAPDRPATALRLAGALALGVGLAAFFLVPAYVEKDQVQLGLAITPGGQNFRNHFLSPGELFGAGQADDPLLVNPSPPRSLGTLPVLLAGAGILAAGWGRARIRPLHARHVAWASLALAGVLAMLSPLSEPLWSHVPLLPFIQYPWRLLGIGSLLVSLLAGTGIAVLDQHASLQGRPTWLGIGLLGCCAAALSLGALPWAYPRQCPTPDNPSQASFTAFETSSGLIGSTSSGEYLPANVLAFPSTSPVAAALRSGQPAVRWDAPGAQVLEAYDDGLYARLVIQNERPLQVLYHAFYFPGWQAHLDGQAVSPAIVPPLGVMGIDVPAGLHSLEVRFGNTPLRTTCELVSLVCAAAVAAIGLYGLRSSRQVSSQRPARAAATRVTWLGLAGLGLAVFALKVGVIDRYDTPLRWRRLQAGQLASVPLASDVIVADRARLLGYAVQPQGAAAGDLVYVDLYWTLIEALDLRAAVRLLDEQGLAWSYKDEADTALIGSYNKPPPASQWPTGTYAHDRHAIQVLPGTPPGDYSIVVVPFDPDTLSPLPVTTGQAAPGDYPGVAIGRLDIMPSTVRLPPSSLDLDTYTNLPLGDDLVLVGYSQDRQQAAPGDAMLLTLGWQARRRPQANYVLRLDLIGPGGDSVTHLAGLVGEARYPTSRWTSGELVRSQLAVHIPGQANSGQHTWRLTLLDGTMPVGQSSLGSLALTAPQRVFSPPPTKQSVNAQLGDWVMLVGFDAPQLAVPGQAICVTLVWQALSTTDQDYKTFVHMLDAGGKLIAQSDAVPAAWSRPTSGWQSGEFVSDAHTLNLEPGLPAGLYRLAAGLYDSQGQRLSLASGGDVVELGSLTVAAP